MPLLPHDCSPKPTYEAPEPLLAEKALAASAPQFLAAIGLERNDEVTWVVLGLSSPVSLRWALHCHKSFEAYRSIVALGSLPIRRSGKW